MEDGRCRIASGDIGQRSGAVSEGIFHNIWEMITGIFDWSSHPNVSTFENVLKGRYFKPGLTIPLIMKVLR
jgi:hypothetical protein